MHNWTCRLQRFREAGEPVDPGDAHLAQTPVLQLGEHLQPELGPLGGGPPQTQQFLVALQVDTQGQVDRLGTDHPMVAHLDHQGVQVEDGVNRRHRPALPGFDLGQHRIRDIRDQARRDFRPRQLLQVPLDLGHRHPAGIQRDDLLVETG